MPTVSDKSREKCKNRVEYILFDVRLPGNWASGQRKLVFEICLAVFGIKARIGHIILSSVL